MTDAAKPDLPDAADAADALAKRVAAALFARDAAAQRMGIQIDAVGAGLARLSMRVRPDMLNGHAICHGGFIFMLADSAFAYACNSRNQSTVASAGMIDFLLPGRLDEVLVAEASEQSLAGRTGVYDIVVTGAEGRRIALFRGKSYRTAGAVIDDAPDGRDPA